MAENRHACDRRNLADPSCLQFRGVRRAARGLQGNVRVTVRAFVCGQSWGPLCWSVTKLFPRSGCSWSFRVWQALSRESCTERGVLPYCVRGVAATKLRVSSRARQGEISVSPSARRRKLCTSSGGSSWAHRRLAHRKDHEGSRLWCYRGHHPRHPGRLNRWLHHAASRVRRSGRFDLHDPGCPRRRGGSHGDRSSCEASLTSSRPLLPEAQDRQLGLDQLAAPVGEDGRPIDQARPVPLACPGRLTKPRLHAARTPSGLTVDASRVKIQRRGVSRSVSITSSIPNEVRSKQ